MTYVELHAHSAYSFLDGASLPEELAARAAELGYEALALTDHDGVYGSLEFAHAAKHLGLRAITGAEVTLAGGATSHFSARAAAATRTSAGSSPTRTRARALDGTRARAAAAAASLELLDEHAEGLVCLSGCARHGARRSATRTPPRGSRTPSAARFYVELQRPFERGDARRNAA